MPIISGSSTGSGGAGTELIRAQITASANITDTSEATATALITCGPFTYTGVAVYAEAFTYQLLSPTSGFVALTLFEGSTEITRLATILGETSLQVGGAVLARYKFTPTAGAHTYKLCGFVASTTGTPQLQAGSGGTAGPPPAYLRFVTA